MNKKGELMIRLMFVIVLAVILLSGCSSLRPSGYEVASLDYYGDGSDVSLSDTYDYYDQATNRVIKKKLPTLFSDFRFRKAEARTKYKGVDEISNYIDAGIALSNKACSEWFSLHNSSYERVDQSQGILNLFGDALIAGLGLGNGNVNAMGYVALLLGGANSGFELFKEGSFLTSTIWKLEKGVRQGRNTLEQTLKTNTKNINFYEAQDELLAYHNTCNRLQLIAYIEESVDLARIVPQGTMSVSDLQKLIEFKKELYKIARDKPGSFADWQVKQLYVVFFAPDSHRAKKYLEQPFSSAVNNRIVDLQKEAANDSVKEKKLADFFDMLEQAGRLLEVDLAKIEQEEQNITAIEEQKENLETGEGDTGKKNNSSPSPPPPESKELREEIDRLLSEPLTGGTSRQPIGLQVIPR